MAKRINVYDQDAHEFTFDVPGKLICEVSWCTEIQSPGIRVCAGHYSEWSVLVENLNFPDFNDWIQDQSRCIYPRRPTAEEQYEALTSS